MPPERKKETANKYLSLTVFALSLLLLLPNLNRHFLWQDEAQTALISKTILANGIPKISDGKNSFSQELGAEAGPDGIYKWHPWLPFYIHAAFFALFGTSDFAARLPDALFGAGTAFICFWIMLSMGRGRREALTAAAVLMLIIPFLVMCRQCRYYSLAAFFSAASVWAYFQFIQLRRWGGILLTLSALMLFHTQLIFGAAFTASVMIHSVFTGRKLFRKLLLPIGGILAGTVPWLVYISDISYRSRYGSTFLNLTDALTRFSFYLTQFRRYIVPLYFLLIIAFTAVIWREKIFAFFGEKKKFTGFFIIYLTITIGSISLAAPYSFFRYLVPIIPVCALLWAEVIESAFRLHTFLGAAYFFTFLVSQPLTKYYGEITTSYTGPMEGLVWYLKNNAAPSDVVAITFGDLPIKWYTGLRVMGGLTGESLQGAENAKWVVIRKIIVCEKDTHVASYLYYNVPWDRYRRIVLPAPDTAFENREEPQEHRYFSPMNADSVVINERI
jgi:4-amino-4-deoxy-L-arabinose transferase-like glycosyltransferase